MRDQQWVVLARHAGCFRACTMQGAVVTGQAMGATEAEVLAALGNPDDRVIRIVEGPPDGVPCDALSDAGLSAITQDQPPAVMGAWARVLIAGYLADRVDWAGVMCLPDGKLTHWVHVSAGEIVSFLSFLTPRVIDLLGGAPELDMDALSETQSRPERLAAHLRQAEVTGNRRAISGHLIGAELAAARVYWLGQEVVVCSDAGDPGYASALEAQGVPVTNCTTDGLAADGLAALGRVMGLCD